MKRKNYLIPVIVWMAAATFVFIACGGGGGGGNGPGGNTTPTVQAPPPGTLATINGTTGDGVVGAAMFGQQINNTMGMSEIIAPLSTSGDNAGAATTIFKVLMDQIKAEVLPADGYQAAGSISDGGDCDFGGTGSISMTWTGPEAPVGSCSEVSDLSATLTMTNCGLDPNMTMGGTVGISISGNLCQPTAMSLSFTNISLNDSSNQVSLTAGSLVMSVTGIEWSGNLSSGGFMTRAQITINGDATGTMDAADYAVAFEDYTQVITTTNDFTYTIDISGKLYGGCLDGWATLRTLTPIEVNDNADCPHAGEIEISGNGSVNIVFNSDGSVTMDGTDYPTCNDMNTGCTL